MKILVAPDSFKGSLTAVEAAEAMAAGIHDYDSSIQTIMLPVADGGEGTMSSLVGATGGYSVSTIVQDPLGRTIEASYGILGDGETCVIELAEASGLTLLDESERNPLVASTFGTGELIVRALDNGFRKFIIGLGGSATNDGGTGVLQALGMKFFDSRGVALAKGGGALHELHKIDATYFDKRISTSTFLIACDVENGFVGPDGASFVFGPQKGATPEMVALLDQGLGKFATAIEKMTGISLHEKTGAGAAGGAGGAFQVFFPGTMKRGIDVVLDAISFEEHLIDADVVLTGEGKTDRQTFAGKAPFGVAKSAGRKGKEVVLISGAIDHESKEYLAPIFKACYAIEDGTVSQEASMQNASHFLRLKTREVMATYFDK